jgi:Protein of Unknown function (DUF2784)
MWRWLADGVVGLHYGYLAYLVGGGFLAWRFHRTIALHALAAVWAALIVVTKVPCPLTALQNTLREQGGQRPLTDSFINLYVRGELFPNDMIGLAQLLVGVVVLTSWVGFALQLRQAGAGRSGSDSAATA